MNCSTCGNNIPDGQMACPSCGTPVQPVSQPVQPMGQPMQPMGQAVQPMSQPAQSMGQPMQPMGQAVQPMGQPMQQMGDYQQPMGQPMQQMGDYQQPMGQPMQQMGGYQQQMGQPMQQMGGYQQQMGQPMQQMGGYQQQVGQPMQQMGGYQQQMGQPMQQMGGYQQQMGQPMQQMGGYQQPMGGGANMGGFVNSLKTDYMKLIGFIGAILIFLSPLFNWVSCKVKMDGESEKQTYNMFGIAGDGDIGIFGFFAVMLLLIGVVLILWDLADYIPAIGRFKAMIIKVPYIELILIAVALLFVILALANGDLNDIIDLTDSMLDYYKELGKSWGYKVSGHANHGLGPVIGILGVVAAAAPRVKKLIKK